MSHPAYGKNWLDERDQTEFQWKDVQKYTYRWKHDKAAESGKRNIFCTSREIFLELLNQWNRDTPTYKYWEASP